jgi:CRISPR-associated protein Csa3
MKKTLITTVYEGQADVIAITKLSPDKVILLGAEWNDKRRDKTFRDAVSLIKKNFGSFIRIETAYTDVYEISKIVRKVCELIDKEANAGNEVCIHISESRKTQAIGAMFAGFIKKDRIKGVYYLVQETNSLMSMPLLDFKLSATKVKILEEMDRGNTDIKSIMKKTGKSKAMIYAHIQELKKDAYLDNDNNLTDAGKIMRG